MAKHDPYDAARPRAALLLRGLERGDVRDMDDDEACQRELVHCMAYGPIHASNVHALDAATVPDPVPVIGSRRSLKKLVVLGLRGSSWWEKSPGCRTL
jgi:hypothetical protein